MTRITSFARYLDGFYRLAGALAAVCLVGMAGFVLISIVARLLGFYVGGATQYSAYLMGAANCLGLAYAFRHGAHIRVTLVVERFSPKVQRWIEVACLLFVTLAACYLTWFLSTQAYVSYDFGDVSEGADQMPLWIPQSALAVGAGILAVATTHTFIAHFLGLLLGREEWLSPLMMSEEQQVLAEARAISDQPSENRHE